MLADASMGMLLASLLLSSRGGRAAQLDANSSRAISDSEPSFIEAPVTAQVALLHLSVQSVEDATAAIRDLIDQIRTNAQRAPASRSPQCSTSSRKQ